MRPEGGSYFILPVSKSIEQDWLFDREQRINETEALSALSFIETYKEMLAGSDLILAMDSAAASGVLVKAYSKTPMLSMIAGAFWSVATSWNIAVWITQLPRRLNPSDGFSRGCRQLGIDHGWNEADAYLPDPAEWRFIRHAFQGHIHHSSQVAAERRAKRLRQQ